MIANQQYNCPLKQCRLTHLLHLFCAVLCNKTMTEAIPIIIQRSRNTPLSVTATYPFNDTDTCYTSAYKVDAKDYLLQ